VRQHLTLALVLVASAARADGTKPKPIDIKPQIDNLDVFRDDAGQVIVSAKPQGIKDDYAKWVFFGDGKTMYQQRVVSSSVLGGRYAWSVWAPRAQGLPQAQITIDANGADVHCKAGADGHIKLAPLPADQAKALLQKATFLPPLWDRTARFLARDDDGIYYFVDELRPEYGGKGYRVFAGKKGAMKELAMTNVASDSAGEVYATKTGELKIVTGTDGKAFWKKGARKTELVTLPPEKNRYLIYRELGIYGKLGALCDDQ
jgi:hypothetical protein